MQISGRFFMSNGGSLRAAVATLSISIPFGFSATALAQEAVQSIEGTTSAPPVVPQQVRYAGKLATRAGDRVEAEFRIYSAVEGGDPLWTETQRVNVAEDGSYSLLLGAASPGGLPQAVFAGGAARWLGVSVERGPEQERVLLSSVPYAMKSADAESLAGHAASDFVTQEQLAQLTQSGQQGIATPALTPLTSGTVTGSGTAGTIPMWTGTLTQGNSEITQVGSDIGINEATPGATLDVGGTATFRGTTTLPAESTATASAGYRSQLLNFTDSAWSTTTNGPVAQTWRLYAVEHSNDTANPTSTLSFQFQNGAGAATPTVLSIEQTGNIDVAPTQTFPGTIASVTATSPVTATTSSGAVSLGLNTSALETTLNALYPQLGTGNVFKSYIEAVQSGGPLTSAVIGAGTNGSTGVFGASDTGLGVYGNVVTPKDGESAILGSTGKAFTFSHTYSNLGSEVSNHIAGVWGDTTGNPNAGQYEKAAGILGTADSWYAGAPFITTVPLRQRCMRRLWETAAQSRGWQRSVMRSRAMPQEESVC